MASSTNPLRRNHIIPTRYSDSEGEGEPSTSTQSRGADPSGSGDYASCGCAKTDAGAAPEFPVCSDMWEKSTSSLASLQKMVDSGLLRVRAFIMWKPAQGEFFPTPSSPKQSVVFESFFSCGFNLPPSAFFREILDFYGVELIHLNPSSISILSIFVHLCETFLGIPPSLPIFRYFYQLERQDNSGSVGGAGFCLRHKVLQSYISMPLRSEWNDWKSKWFYCTVPAARSGEHDNPLPYRGSLPCPIGNWTNPPRLNHKQQELVKRIKQLRNIGLTGWHVAANFIMRRISPLKWRDRYGYQYSGSDDADRDHAEDLPDEEIYNRADKLFEKRPPEETIPEELIYSAQNPPTPPEIVPVPVRAAAAANPETAVAVDCQTLSGFMSTSPVQSLKRSLEGSAASSKQNPNKMRRKQNDSDGNRYSDLRPQKKQSSSLILVSSTPSTMRLQPRLDIHEAVPSSATSSKYSKNAPNTTTFSKILDIVEAAKNLCLTLQKGNDYIESLDLKATQYDTLLARVNEIPSLKSKIQNLTEEKNALIALGEKHKVTLGELEAELKSAKAEVERCQTEEIDLRSRIDTLEKDKLVLEDAQNVALTVYQVEQAKMIRDKSARDAEIKTFQADLKKTKSHVESYKSQLKAAKHEKEAVIQKLRTFKEKATCHLIDTAISCSSYMLALVQSLDPDFDFSNINKAFHRPDPKIEALIETNKGLLGKFIETFDPQFPRSFSTLEYLMTKMVMVHDVYVMHLCLF